MSRGRLIEPQFLVNEGIDQIELRSYDPLVLYIVRLLRLVKVATKQDTSSSSSPSSLLAMSKQSESGTVRCNSLLGAVILTFLSAPAPFEPTPSSVPPPGARYRIKLPPGLPVNITPLNPIQFPLRAALIQPDKIAIRHPDVEHPVEYSYAVW